jgi:hypothetical protein
MSVRFWNFGTISIVWMQTRSAAKSFTAASAGVEPGVSWTS